MSQKAWGGVFAEATDRRVEQFTESVSFDRRLYAHDIRGSVAHVQMLAAVGCLTADEASRIESALGEIGEDIAAGRFEFRTELEDIHTHIERALIDRLGDVGRKLHTGRSRNDQVSTDLRMWVREAIDAIDARLADVQRAFVERCPGDLDCVLPGYTHMRRAQPVLAPHYWLAYCEKFARDRDRLADCRRRANVLGLGAAALAGTSVPIDRFDVARRLGFEGVAANSLDVSSDRDFAIEFGFVLAMVAEHLSHWAEEWILWSGTEYAFLRLPQPFCTGSSIMPQKVNPDVLELVRGKTARVVGNLTRLLVLVKGLPLAYNRDLQEDKEALFDSFDTVNACLELAAPLILQTRLDRESIESRLEEGHLDATTLMEYLVRRGVPQRTAHERVGNWVRLAMERRKRLADLPLADFQAADPTLDDGVYGVLGAKNAVRAFVSYGSTAPDQVARQIEAWQKKLGPQP